MSIGEMIKTGSKLLFAGAAAGGMQYGVVKIVEGVASKDLVTKVSSKVFNKHGSTIVKCVGQTAAGIGTLLAGEKFYHKYWGTTSTIFGENSEIVALTGDQAAKLAIEHPEFFQ